MMVYKTFMECMVCGERPTRIYYTLYSSDYTVALCDLHGKQLLYDPVEKWDTDLKKVLGKV